MAAVTVVRPAAAAARPATALKLRCGLCDCRKRLLRVQSWILHCVCRSTRISCTPPAWREAAQGTLISYCYDKICRRLRAAGCIVSGKGRARRGGGTARRQETGHHNEEI